MYTDLLSREDRRAITEKDLKKIGFDNVKRFEAIAATPGILGCARSHLALLKSLEPANEPFLVCEDNIEFQS